MKIIVTGGAGFIGSHITDLLVERGHTVVVFDNLSSGRRENINHRAMTVLRDITEGDVFAEFVRQFKPDAVCHQAAQPSLRRSLEDPCADADINIIGTLKVIQAAKAAGAYMVMASTSAVYDPDGKLPYLESDPVRPNLPYGIAKAAGEMYLTNSGLQAAVLRYGNVYGPRQIKVGENQLVPHCLGFLLRGEPFVINGDGFQTRDFVYVGDIARANVDAIEHGVTGTFNIATGQPCSVGLVCLELAVQCGTEYKNELFEHGPAKPGEPKHVRLDNHKAAYWWRPRVDLQEGLSLTVKAWQREQALQTS